MQLILFLLADILLAAAMYFSAREATIRLMDHTTTLSNVLYSLVFLGASVILTGMILIFTTFTAAWYFNLEL